MTGSLHEIHLDDHVRHRVRVMAHRLDLRIGQTDRIIAKKPAAPLDRVNRQRAFAAVLVGSRSATGDLARGTL